MCKMSVGRNYSLDVIRTIAIFFVVANHAVEFIFPFYKANALDLFHDMSYTYQFFQFFVFTMGRLGVPLFLMLTGYLLVPRDYNTKEKIIRFYKRNFIGLVSVWYIWIVLYNIFFFVFESKQFVIKDIFSELLLIKKGSVDAYMVYERDYYNLCNITTIIFCYKENQEAISHYKSYFSNSFDYIRK